MSWDTLIQLLLSIVVPSSVAAWVYRRWSLRLVVRRITDPKDTDLENALALYQRRIKDPNVRDSSEEIIRWLEELVEEERKGRVKLKDYLIVAKRSRFVCGLFYGQFFPASGFLFVSYFVSNEGSIEGRRGVASKAICQYLKRELRHSLRGCGGIAFELERPSRDNKEGWLARWRSFQRVAGDIGLTIKRLDVIYRQPRLVLSDEVYTEAEQYLFYARTQPPPIGETVSKAEVVGLLSALYRDWYGQAFEYDPEEDMKYRAYLEELLADATKALPEAVPALSRPLRRGRNALEHQGGGPPNPAPAPGC